jgi:Leucine Rich repeat
MKRQKTSSSSLLSRAEKSALAYYFGESQPLECCEQLLDDALARVGLDGLSHRSCILAKLSSPRHKELALRALNALGEKLLDSNRSRLHYLDLSRCGTNVAGAHGAALIARAIGSGLASGLSAVDLTGNMIGNDGAVALARALKTAPNGALVTLLLANNSIGDVGLEALFDALRVNRALGTLNVFGNVCRPQLAAMLDDVLDDNYALGVASITFVGDSVAASCSIRAKLVRNRRAALLRNVSLRQRCFLMLRSMHIDCSPHLPAPVHQQLVEWLQWHIHWHSESEEARRE